jgi:hypothetical protein
MADESDCGSYDGEIEDIFVELAVSDTPVSEV